MKDSRLLSAAIIILAAAIVFSGIWIGSRLDRSTEAAEQSRIAAAEDKALMNLDEAAAFLNIDRKTFVDMLSKESSNQGVYDSSSYNNIPYIVIRGQKYFTRQELILWANANAQRGSRYN